MTFAAGYILGMATVAVFAYVRIAIGHLDMHMHDTAAAAVERRFGAERQGERRHDSNVRIS